MEEGLLPNLEGLARAGTSGELRSHYPLLSPRVWTSIATGKAPEKHRIEGWVHGEGRRKGRLYRSSDRAGYALWNMLTDRGLSVGVVNWLMTYPPEKITGVMVSDYALPGQRQRREELGDMFGRQASLPEERASRAITVWPESWRQPLSRVARSAARPERVDDPVAPWADDVFVKPLIEKPRHTDDLVVRTALEVDKRERPDVTMVLLQGIDQVSHFFWAGVEPPEAYHEDRRIPAAQARQYRSILRRYYAYTDALIGALVARFDSDDLILVVSDHGFEARTETPDNTGGHQTPKAEFGVVFARGPGVPARKVVEGMSVNDVTPTILAWLGLPVASDMDGRPASFLDVKTPATIPTYDLKPIERIETTADDLERDLIKRLRSLGYLQ